jgi:copper transport protein
LLFAGVFASAATSQRLSRVLSLLALVGVGVALALSGHASNAEPRAISRPAVFVHAICMTFWVGSLPLSLHCARRAATRRWRGSPPFGSLVLLAASRLWLAYARRPDRRALDHRPAGWLASC